MDPHTPWEETMCALHDLIKMGKIRYIGASSMPTWEFQKANYIAEKNGWTQFISMQNLYNLLYREEEREMIPYCLDQKVAGIPYMGLCGGYLTGKDRSDTPRSKKNKENILNVIRTCSGTREEHDVVVDKVIAIAEKRGISPAQVNKDYDKLNDGLYLFNYIHFIIITALILFYFTSFTFFLLLFYFYYIS